MSKNYWQIAAGSNGRDYTKAFLRYGMAFVGDDRDRMDEVAEGDVVILKKGMSQIAAVGRAVNREGKVSGNGDKSWLLDFDGWELPAYCHVDWHVPPQPVAADGLTRHTMQGINKLELRSHADALLTETPVHTEGIPEPAPTREVKDDEILDFLIKEGLRPSAAEDLTAAFRRIRLLARYYYRHCNWDNVREHETRSFLILPLLLALGWPEQRIKVEFEYVDVACFNKPYHQKGADCVLLLESKGFSKGLDYAPDQARGYAAKFPTCGTVVVSNGYCYKAYRRDKSGVFSLTPSAYLNLLSPQDRYPLDPANVEGCLEVMRLLMPANCCM